MVLWTGRAFPAGFSVLRHNLKMDLNAPLDLYFEEYK